jgi:tungstate transport system substrate-binding protein
VAKNRRRVTIAIATAFIAALAQLASAASPSADRFITVASTTSTENSGLFGYILPPFKAKTGIDVHVVALGTGQALDVGRRGDADVVFVHDTAAELKFVDEGYGVGRRDVMYNDFVLIGPASDPAHVAGMSNIAAAMTAIRDARAPFVSRGDRSGTHAAELRLWTAAGIDIESAKGPWYRETGAGMGATLNTASAMDAYLLADRGTWLSFQNRGNLRVLVEGDPRLFNQYGVILVNPERNPHVKHADAQAFIDWLVSPDGQAAIASYKIGGEQAFFPDSNGTGDRKHD